MPAVSLTVSLSPAVIVSQAVRLGRAARPGGEQRGLAEARRRRDERQGSGHRLVEPLEEALAVDVLGPQRRAA